MELPLLRDWVVHPGEVLEQFMEDDGLSVQQVAESMGISQSAVNKFLSYEDVEVDLSLARRLESATGFPAQCWVNLENRYRVDAARLLPLQIGLFENLDEFVQVEVEVAESMRKSIIHSLKGHGDNDDMLAAKILSEVREFLILMESHDDKVHFEIRLGDFGGPIILAGPKLSASIRHTLYVMPLTTGDQLQTRPISLTPAAIKAQPAYAFASA